ncbi:hypothetical protein [Streptomyces sp. MK5]|uniref:hypothetical protein n=1 Tax=Streptomyces sp. MK5 TaxID=3064253 RepID=UPI0027424C78|nr:hypothetical protein [Streptomyces sp. MK5]
MFDNQAARKKLPRRGRTARAATCVGAALMAAGIGMHPAAAATATGSAGRPATATADSSLSGSRLGLADLIQKADFYQQGLNPVSATVGMTGKQALSACSGEETMQALTKGKAGAYADVTWTFDTKDTLLTESVAETSTTTSAASYENRLDRLVRSCQDEPAGHWYYGQGHAITLKTGQGRWYPAFKGDGEAAGGVAVIRSGHRFGIVGLSGQPSDDPGYMEGIAAIAINRLSA